MTSQEFKNRTYEEDGYYIVTVEEHKRMEDGPAFIVLTPELTEALLTYEKCFRPLVVKVPTKYLFLSWNGLKMSSGIQSHPCIHIHEYLSQSFFYI